MANSTRKSKDISFTVNILIKKEKGLFVAHCLELDIVATGKTPTEAQKEIISLVCTQVDYAFSNNNLDHLYHPAPPRVWAEFFSCKEQLESGSSHIAMVEINITDVKSDVTRVASVISGVKCEINEKFEKMTRDIYKEMMK